MPREAGPTFIGLLPLIGLVILARLRVREIVYEPAEPQPFWGGVSDR